MSISAVLLVVVVGCLAYVNGANDNFKGVATLFGSGTTSYRKALVWAALTTLLGSLSAIFLAGKLIKAFSGKGLVSAAAVGDPAFLLAVSAGAAATVLLATLLGFPISTTHGIIGALIGAGLLAPGGVAFGQLAGKFLLPLLLTPFAAIAATFALYAVFRRVRVRLGVVHETCICVGEVQQLIAPETPALQLADGGQIALGSAAIGPRLSVSMDAEPRCVQRYRGRVMGVRAQTLLDVMHYLSAGAVGFARGLQDTGKIVGLLVGAALLKITITSDLLWGVALVAILMAAGGMLNARRVANTLGSKITAMNHGQGFTANLVTSVLVIGAALWGAPVSTTHCSVGALFGIGAATHNARWRTIGSILLAWILTLPLAALLAGGIYLLLR